jgi:hypothetical protein
VENDGIEDPLMKSVPGSYELLWTYEKSQMVGRHTSQRTSTCCQPHSSGDFRIKVGGQNSHTGRE